MFTKENFLIFYVVYIVVLSIITFFSYGIDKRRAIKGKTRTREKTLLLLSILGGAIGGTLGMKIFHHKTLKEHWYFKVVNIIGIILHVGIFLLMLFTLGK